eukprot:CAMPEP_0179051746 /NCGR_PEP_ID=MMETSP0796-20121207/21402_1 /TAXON_ID=73915 /ORGANISM="Pyrodinium bahamense, Strain pbaha01" /LENGTH=101 /DNA_ID=CAMNT_0020748293 /DNA_START=412 /DNA_END=714 /DNA_ORIENTATION=+
MNLTCHAASASAASAISPAISEIGLHFPSLIVAYPAWQIHLLLVHEVGPREESHPQNLHVPPVSVAKSISPVAKSISPVISEIGLHFPSPIVAYLAWQIHL